MSFLGSLFGKRVTRRVKAKANAKQSKAKQPKAKQPKAHLQIAPFRLPHLMFQMPMVRIRPTVKRQNYDSTQFHRESVNGEEVVKIQRVAIDGKKGFKEVTIQQKGKQKTSKKPLTRKEISCIQQCQYMPSLFNDCEQKCLT